MILACSFIDIFVIICNELKTFQNYFLMICISKALTDVIEIIKIDKNKLFDWLNELCVL